VVRPLALLVVLAAGAGTAAAERWRELLDGHGEAVLVSADEDQVVLLRYVQTEMYDEQVVAEACPTGLAKLASRNGCEHFAIKVPEDGTDPTAEARFDRLISDRGFTSIPMRRAKRGAARLGGTTVKLRGTAVEIRRGARRAVTHRFEDIEEGEEVPTLTGAGVTPGRNVVVVIDGLFVHLVPGR
jgi:hypothetical protein